MVHRRPQNPICCPSGSRLANSRRAAARDVRRRQSDKRAGHEQCERDAERAGDHREEQVLHHKLAGELPRVGADRRSHRDFALTRLAPREEEVSHVDARDHQDHPDRGQQDEQRRSAARESPLERLEVHAARLVRRIGALEVRANGGHFLLRGAERGASAFRRPIMMSGCVSRTRRGIGLQRRPDVYDAAGVAIDEAAAVVGGREHLRSPKSAPSPTTPATVRTQSSSRSVRPTTCDRA